MKYPVKLFKVSLKKSFVFNRKTFIGEPTQFCQYGINLHANEAGLFILILLMRGRFFGARSMHRILP